MKSFIEINLHVKIPYPWVMSQKSAWIDSVTSFHTNL